MEQSVQVDILKELLRQLDEGKNIDAGVQYRMPTTSYVCSDQAKKEWDAFFQGHPQMIGLSGELPGPGTFITMDDFGTPVLATRDKTGRFRAFLNSCRHRAARVANDARGKASMFTCPFHHWGYGNTGELISIPNEDHFGPIDKSCNGLFDIALLGERDVETDLHEVISIEKYQIDENSDTITIFSDVKPHAVGIDPFNKLIDRNPDDNIKSIGS